MNIRVEFLNSLSMVKFLSGVLLLIVVSLLVFSSIGFGLIHLKLWDHGVDISPKGVEIYIHELGSYKGLFLATVTVTAAYLGLKRLKAATDANEDKLRNDRFNEWKIVLESRIQEQLIWDPYMKRCFVHIRYRLFQTLYRLDFNIESIDDLRIMFSHFETPNNNIPAFLEEQSNRSKDMGGYYPNENYLYSFDSFRYIIYGCINEAYDNFESDLRALYLDRAKLSTMRTVDKELYMIAMDNYKPTKRDSN
jgi:hypothetical protein